MKNFDERRSILKCVENGVWCARWTTYVHYHIFPWFFYDFEWPSQLKTKNIILKQAETLQFTKKSQKKGYQYLEFWHFRKVCFTWFYPLTLHFLRNYWKKFFTCVDETKKKSCCILSGRHCINKYLILERLVYWSECLGYYVSGIVYL